MNNIPIALFLYFSYWLLKQLKVNPKIPSKCQLRTGSGFMSKDKAGYHPHFK